jgi:hypothetical protein
LLSNPPNFAYLDAGSGSLILQVLAGGAAAAAVSAKLFWKRILVFLRIRKPDEATAPTDGGGSNSDAL